MRMPYHAGLVVADLDHAMKRLSDRFGYIFNDPTTVSIPELDDRILRTSEPIELVVAYTRQGPFRLEVIQAQGSGIYAATRAGLHHLGVWEPDAQARLAELESGGDAVRAVIRRRDSAASAFYAEAPESPGLLVEYVNEDRRPQLEEWFNTGIMPA
jgi:catechol 2,3-dioxygenase-like lactoylglutathione lyase family enzyme